MLRDFFTQLLYVQVSPEKLTVRDPKAGVSISEVPEVAIAYDPKANILGVGKDAHSHKAKPTVKIVNPFAHPRSMVSDFTVGEQLLKAFVLRVRGSSIFSPAPKIVMHLLGDPDGGFTQVEARAFHEMALGAGASEVVVWQGRALSDQEIISGQFPNDGKVLSPPRG